MRDTAGLGRKSGLWGEMCQTLIIIQAGKSEKSHSCPKPNIQRWTAGAQNTPARGPWSCNSRLLEGQETFRNWGVGERHLLISVSKSKGVFFLSRWGRRKDPPEERSSDFPHCPYLSLWSTLESSGCHSQYMRITCRACQNLLGPHPRVSDWVRLLGAAAAAVGPHPYPPLYTSPPHTLLRTAALQESWWATYWGSLHRNVRLWAWAWGPRGLMPGVQVLWLLGNQQPSEVR